MVQVTKKKKETTLSLMKRFNRKLQKSSNLLRFKSARFKARTKSDLTKKKTALSREKRREKINKLYKLGKLEQRSRATGRKK